MAQEIKADLIKKKIGEWVTKETKVELVDVNTYEVATTQIDAYGDTVYCFVEKVGQYYQVSDDSHILFKLDPGETDQELYQTGEEVALGAGFEFDEKTGEISVTTDVDNLAQAIMRLAQLQVAISYLG